MATTVESSSAQVPPSPKQLEQSIPKDEGLENGVNNGQDGVDVVENLVNGMSLEQQPMESGLHRSCAEGNLEEVRAILSRSLDGLEAVEMTTGCTPIVLAIQNNHPDVVRELLSAGAIVPPPGLTADPLLNSILYPQMMYNMPPQFVGQHLPPQDFFPQGYYPEAQRGGMYMPYPSHQNGNGPAPHRKEASPNGQNQGVNNLPPAEVAKTIPCRNFPNCKYGSSCAFSHPRPGFFQSGPPMPNGNFGSSYDQFGGFQAQPGMPPFYPNDFGSNGLPRLPVQDQQSLNGQVQQKSQQQTPASQDTSDNTQHDSIPAGNHVPSALTPAFIPAFQPAQPQQIHQQLDPQSYLSSPPPASQFGLSPMSPSLLTSPPPAIPSAEAFFAASPPNGGMMLPPSGMMQSLNGMNGNGQIRRQSFNQPFGMPGRPFGHGKKPSFSGPNGQKPSWMGRASLGGSGANGNLGAWKDGNPPVCAFYLQAKCRNGDYCKFPHIDAEGNDTRHPDVVRGIIPPAPPLPRQPRSTAMRMMPPNSFGQFDPNFRQQQVQQQLHFLQQQKMAAASAQQVNGTQTVPELNESAPAAETEASPAAETEGTSTASVLHPSVPAKPTLAAPPITRSASQPGVNRVPVSGISSRAHSPAPSNVSFHGNGHPRRAGSRVPYPNGQAPPVNGVRSASSQSADSKKVNGHINGNGMNGQRIPGADEFPALSMGNGEKKEVGWGGKTAAQVLSEPAPPKPVKAVAPAETEDHEDSMSSQSDSQGVTMDSESDSDAVLISRKPTPAPAQAKTSSSTAAPAKPEIKRAGVSFASVASSVGISASSAMESAPLVKA